MKFALAALPLCLILVRVAPLQAKEAPLESHLTMVGGRISAALSGANIRTVALKVRGLNKLPSAAPAMVQETLARKLLSDGINVEPNADLIVDVRMEMDEKLGKSKTGRLQVEKLILKIDFAFSDKNANKLFTADENPYIDITDQAEISRILGIPFESHPGATAPNGKPAEGDGLGFEGAGGVVDGYKKPNQFVTNETIVRATGNGKFGVQLIVDGQRRKASTTDGFAFAKLTRGEKCQIRLINDADYEVAVRLMLDGIDSFWFTDRNKALWLVPPRSSKLVGGWQQNNKEAERFQVVPFEESVAAKLGQTGSIGVISATFRRSYLENEDVPKEDLSIALKNVGIGRGEAYSNPIVFLPRQLGKIRATVPVRYVKPKLR